MRDAEMPMLTIAGGIPKEKPFITAAENKKNTQTVIDDLSLIHI